MRCRKCGEQVQEGENPNVTINIHTGQAHKCNPAKLKVPGGKWAGYSFEEMARMWWNKKQADKNVKTTGIS